MSLEPPKFQFYGRRKGKPLRRHHVGLMENLLPQFSVDIDAPLDRAFIEHERPESVGHLRQHLVEREVKPSAASFQDLVRSKFSRPDAPVVVRVGRVEIVGRADRSDGHPRVHAVKFTVGRPLSPGRVFAALDFKIEVHGGLGGQRGRKSR